MVIRIITGRRDAGERTTKKKPADKIMPFEVNWAILQHPSNGFSTCTVAYREFNELYRHGEFSELLWFLHADEKVIIRVW